MSGGAGVGALLPDPPSVESTLSATLVTAKRPRLTGELTGLLAEDASEAVDEATVSTLRHGTKQQKDTEGTGGKTFKGYKETVSCIDVEK